jgi:glycosyltransferase involved in cell wall biosynthesis
MAAGCPVAVSTAASIPEVCGDAAAFFDPLDVDDMARVIKEVLTDPELRARLIEKGRKRAETFTWDTSARQLSEIIAHHFDLSR